MSIPKTQFVDHKQLKKSQHICIKLLLRTMEPNRSLAIVQLLNLASLLNNNLSCKPNQQSTDQQETPTFNKPLPFRRNPHTNNISHLVPSSQACYSNSPRRNCASLQNLQLRTIVTTSLSLHVLKTHA